VSEVLYERYKDALRRGHIAALRGSPDEALGAYQEAIGIAPDRALPYVSLGGVLARLGRSDEALVAFDRALVRSPSDEAAWRGRADVLVAAHRRTEAAESLDRLAAVLDGQGRVAEACDTAREGLELAESRGRRRDLEAFARRLRSDGRDAASTAALGRALAVLREPASMPRAASGSAESIQPAVDGQGGRDEPLAKAGSPQQAPAQTDQADLMAATEAAIDRGDVDAVRTRALAASAAQRASGLLEAALDTCHMALGVVPADPDIHLALAELYLDRGWRVSAVDKIILLGRLADLTDDDATRDRLAALVRERLRDEPRLAARYG